MPSPLPLRRGVVVAAAAAAALGAVACQAPPTDVADYLTRRWESQEFAGCLFGSPLLAAPPGEGESVVVVSADGTVAAIDPDNGATRWSFQLPTAEGLEPLVVATPALVGNRLVVAWQEQEPMTGTRVIHHVSVVDLATHALDPAFPPVTLTAEIPTSDGTGTVPFLPRNSLSRSTVAHARPPGAALGVVYVSYGNIRDIQPWHGWVFEVDLDRWLADGAPSAVTGVLLTTPENVCGVPGESGSDDMICGGGVWAPAGPQVVPRDDGGYDLLVPTGNGQLDLGRKDYANTILRTGHGLAFDPTCDPVACADFDPIDPAVACLESCEDLFIPRLPPEQPFFDPPDGRCDGLTFFECYAILDWDLGANAPAQVELADGTRVLVIPAKDGGVYLADADHLGTLYDREPLVEVCGSDGAHCQANWAGMMVTEPVIVELDGTQVALVSTFVEDELHPAGLFALAIRDGGGAGGTPSLEVLWRAPDLESPEARDAFRIHPSRVALADVDGEKVAVLVDTYGASDKRGRVFAVRVSDGHILGRSDLPAGGQRFSEPLTRGASVYLATCGSWNDGPGRLVGYDLGRED